MENKRGRQTEVKLRQILYENWAMKLSNLSIWQAASEFSINYRTYLYYDNMFKNNIFKIIFFNT